MIKRIVTFNIGGPMNGYYAILDAETENIIRDFCAEHWPKDWVTTYDPLEFRPQIERFKLKLLCYGWLEFYNDKIYFHEKHPWTKVNDNSKYQTGLDSPDYEKKMVE